MVRGGAWTPLDLTCYSPQTTKYCIMPTRQRLALRMLLLLLAACRSSSFAPQNHRFITHHRPSQVTLNGASVSAVETFFITKPYVAAFLTCSVKASAADWIAQTRAQCCSNVDVSRNLAFLVYGGLYQGMTQQFIYSTVFPGMFGHDLDIVGLASKWALTCVSLGHFCVCHWPMQ